MKRWKYHSDSGAYEFFPTKDELVLKSTAKTTNQLTEENEKLRNNLDSLLKIMMEKNVITKEEADQITKE